MREFTTSRRLLACACVMLFASALAGAKGWRGIVPLRSTRADVERRLGKPNPRNQHYEFRSERAFVMYSAGGGCAEGAGGGWDVPRGTVVSIVVTPKVRLRFAALRLDAKKYQRVADPEVTAHALYTNEGDGLTYRVFEGGGKEDGRVLKVQFEPAAKDRHLRCPEERPAAPGAAGRGGRGSPTGGRREPAASRGGRLPSR